MDDTKNALLSALSKLNSNDMFTIIAFNGESHLYSKSMELASNDAVERAREWINLNFVAGGGTNISHPLNTVHWIYAVFSKHEVPKIIKQWLILNQHVMYWTNESIYALLAEIIPQTMLHWFVLRLAFDVLLITLLIVLCPLLLRTIYLCICCLFCSGNRNSIRCSKFSSDNFPSYRWNCWRWETNLYYGKKSYDQWRVYMPSNLHFWYRYVF